jgi:hypothetical protein
VEIVIVFGVIDAQTNRDVFTFGGGADDNFLGAGLDVGFGFFGFGEAAG